jgi:hypothetical protein
MKKEMIKRADGSVSQRGLWDNIRANRGSGKKPTPNMLEQEREIKSKSKKKSKEIDRKKKMKMGGSLKPVDKAKNPGLAKLPTGVRNKMGYQKYGGDVDMMQAGGVVKSQPRRVGPVDPGPWTDIQKRTLAGVKVKKVPLTKDKELDASAVERKQAGDVAKNGKWIQKAIKKPGALRAQLGAKKGEPIAAGKLAAAAKKGGKLGQRARLAQTLKKMKK